MRRRILMRKSDQDDDDAGAEHAKTPGPQAPVSKVGHGEFFEREQLEILIAKLVHERHIAAISLQRHIFGKVPSVVTWYSTYTRALTFH